MSRRAATLVVAVAVALVAAPQAARADAAFVETADGLVLENEAVRLTFSKVAFLGSLVGLQDRASGTDLMAGLPYPAALFALTIVDSPCQGTQVHNLSPGLFSYRGEVGADGALLELGYTGVGQRQLDVHATVLLPHHSPRAEWRLEVDVADPLLALRSVDFPLALVSSTIGQSATDDELVLPLLDGVLVREPGAAFAPGSGLVATYPADLSLQMLAFSDDSTGLYLAALDPGGRTKTIGWTRVDVEGRAAALISLSRAVEELPGQSLGSTEPVELGLLEGDWFDAAQLYRDWALAQGWTPPPLRERASGSFWWQRAPAVVSSAAYGDDGTAYLPASQMAARAAEYADRIGLPVTLLLFGWEQHGAWTSPGVFPPRDGAAAFTEATAALGAGGNHAYVYLSGSVWRLSRPGLPDYDDSQRFEAIGRPHAIWTCDGSPLLDPFYASIGWASVRMCPATSFWQDTVAGSVETAAGLGIDAVSVDEFPIGSVHPCYAIDHGHPPGSGTWPGSAYRSLLTRARARGRALNPGLALTAEEPCELYLDLLDGYVSRDNQPDGFMYGPFLRTLGDRFQPVPVFSAVYHERAIAVAEPTPLYDAVGSLEALRISRARGLASGFILGKIPSASVVPIAEADPQLLDLFRRAATMVAGAAAEYAIHGSMLRPLDLDVPLVEFQWADVDLATGQLTLRDESAPAVLSSVWQGPRQGRAVLLANITPQPQLVAVPTPGDGVPRPLTVSRQVDGVQTVLYSGSQPPVTVEVELPAWALAMVEVRPHDWRTGDGRVGPAGP